MARVGRGTAEGAGGRAGWDGVSGDGCGSRRRPCRRLFAPHLPQAVGGGVRTAFSLWVRPVHRHGEQRGRCEGWRAGGRALAGVVGGRGVALTCSHAVARDVCFARSLCTLLLPPAPCVRSWAAVAASHTSPKLLHGFLSGVRTVLAVCKSRVFLRTRFQSIRCHVTRGRWLGCVDVRGRCETLFCRW